MEAYPINFESPPAIGTTIRYFRGRMLRLVDVTAHVRRDGTCSFILTWETSKGRRCTSGLKAKEVSWRDGAI